MVSGSLEFSLQDNKPNEHLQELGYLSLATQIPLWQMLCIKDQCKLPRPIKLLKVLHRTLHKKKMTERERERWLNISDTLSHQLQENIRQIIKKRKTFHHQMQE